MPKRLSLDLIHCEAQNAFIAKAIESICNDALGQISDKIKGNFKFNWYL